MLDRTSGGVWHGAAPHQKLVGVRRLSRRAAKLSCVDDRVPLTFTATIELDLEDPEFNVTLEADPTAPVKDWMWYPAPLRCGDRDLIVLPYAEGMIFPAADLSFERWFQYSDWKSAQGWAGATDGTAGWMAILDTPFDGGFEIKKEGGRLAVCPMWTGRKATFGPARRIRYAFFETGGHVALACRYRRWAQRKGWVLPFTQKRRWGAPLDGLMGAVDLWALDGGLPKDFFEDLSACGVTRALASLGGGWQPPKGVAEKVKRLNELGYLPGHYDIYTDVWNPADRPPEWLRTDGYPDQVIRDADGKPHKGWVDKSEGREHQGYVICSTFHAAAARTRIAADLKDAPYRSRFIDVETASGPYECWSKAHPADRADDAKARAGLLACVAREFKLVTGSEEIREWAVPFSDWSEGTMTLVPPSNAGYDWGTSVDPEPAYLKLNASAEFRAPLFELVFHDCHVSTWYTGDGSTKVPACRRAKDLLNLLYGTMPLWMPDAGQWKKHREDLLASYHTVNAVFAAVAGTEMTNHEFLTADRAVQRTTFSNGVRVTANFGATPYVTDPQAPGGPRTLPRYGYVAEGPGLTGWRMTWSGRTVEMMRIADRVFLDAGGAPFDAGPLKTDGRAVLFRRGGGWRVVTLGRCTRVSIRPSDLVPADRLAKAAVYSLDRDHNRGKPAATTHDGTGLAFVPGSAAELFDVE